ncbi:MAG: hypothetical protein JXB04_01825 [Kiritimatiellae bacterium]|nr:hypothetical protein [Kiritimatiellia bacterium]
MTRCAHNRPFPPAVLLALALLLAGAAAVSAGTVAFRSAEHYTLDSATTLSKQLWLSADTARFDGTVEDDLFVSCRSATFAGSFRNDVWCLGENIELHGYIADHARLCAARLVNVQGRVGSTLMVIASSVTVGRPADIRGDALLMAESVTLEGRVGGRAVLVGYEATLGGRVDGNVRIIADDIVVLPDTVIEGDLVYTSAKELFLDTSVTLRGELIRKDVAATPSARRALTFRQRLSIQSFFFVGAFLAGIAWIGLFPGTSGRAVRQLRQAGWRSLLAGFVAFGLLPMAAVFLLFTIIGIPLSLVLATAYVLLLYLSKMVAALGLGAVLLRRRGPQPFGQAVAALGLGLLVLYGLALVPTAGTLVWFIATLLGLGGLVLGLLSSERTPPALPSEPPVPPPFVVKPEGGPSSSTEKPQQPHS